MAPGIISDLPIHSESTQSGANGTNGVHKKSAYPEPLKPSGKLDEFQWEDATPIIGREYPSVNIVDDLMNASNADELLRDLAIASKDHGDDPIKVIKLTFFAVSQRGVVFFRSQGRIE